MTSSMAEPTLKGRLQVSHILLRELVFLVQTGGFASKGTEGRQLISQPGKKTEPYACCEGTVLWTLLTGHSCQAVPGRELQPWERRRFKA